MFWNWPAFPRTLWRPIVILWVTAWKCCCVAPCLRISRQGFLPCAGKRPIRLRASVRLLGLLAECHREREGVFTKVFPGIPELLAVLRERGAGLAVFSNKPQERVERAVAGFFPDTPFFQVRGARPGVALKPDPHGVLAVAREGGFAPEEVVYLGDSDVDMRTAINAGMYPAGAGWGFRGEEELRQAGAAEVFSRPQDVLRLFDQDVLRLFDRNALRLFDQDAARPLAQSISRLP